MTLHLHHEMTGPHGAPPLVLLNSIGTTSAIWAPQLGALSEQFRVLTVDTRGHGGSPATVHGQMTSIADLGADVLAVLDRLDLRRVHLAGLSLGGMTAMWLAAYHPERVDRLALLCTSANFTPALAWRDRAEAVRTSGLDSIADSIVHRWITPGLAERDPSLLGGLRALLTSTDAESYAQCCEAIAAMDLRTDLARITAPTLVIAAAKDPTIPPEHAQRITDGITGARLKIVEDAAHIATLEQCGPITALIQEHFGGGATLAAGYTTRRAVLGDQHVDRAIATTTDLTAPFQEFLTRYAWGDVWTRPGLTRRDRSIATLAALVALGADHEIAMHVRAAITNGLTPHEIAELLLHTSVYAGLPRANRAFAITQRTLDDVAASAAPEQET